ncbi:hypothetical protein CS0771_08640 [Catellatospora sp. IY07-71]|uniref:hypothetical protein n=1 Tax=Catellatospora sp. IY07-71 TaxID=2728827 RepID=UPI001BB35D14|nr:hypothetical protein [Catellatospora sp. IY07-71]BCJ71320.1 hypothetical protein CS0771_08640 [Catellatospora sp. IY07-71]
MHPEDANDAAGPALPAGWQPFEDTGTGPVDPWAEGGAELPDRHLPLDHEDPTPSAVIMAAQSAPPPPDEPPTAPITVAPLPDRTASDATTVLPPASPPAAAPPPGTGTWPAAQPPHGSGAWPVVHPQHGSGAWPVVHPQHGSGAWPVVHPQHGSGAWPVVQPQRGSGAWPVVQPHGTGAQPVVSGVPGYPQQVPSWPVAPPPRRRWGRLIVLLAVLLVVACLVAGGTAVLVFPWLRDRVTGGGTAPDGSAPSPGFGASLPDRQAWIKDRIGAALGAQQKALLSGDEQGYLAVVDPAAEVKVRDGLRRQFRSLRAMQVAAWTEQPTHPLPAPDGQVWITELRSTPCFVTPICSSAPARAATRWRIADGRALLREWAPVQVQPSPHPWQVAELVAVAGPRTVVATTPEHEDRLARLLTEAEKAAKVADRFARPGKLPPRYVVYHAGDGAWGTWFSWKPGQHVSGGAVRVGPERWEIVLNERDSGPAMAGGVLRHELAHAASLAGLSDDDDKLWWLQEGLAEYAGLNGRRVRDYLRLTEIRRLMKQWDGDVESALPPRDAPAWQVVARYGVSGLTVRYLADRFGEAKFVDFFHRVVHDGKSVTEVSPQVFGVAWGALERDCAAYIRRTAA